MVLATVAAFALLAPAASAKEEVHFDPDSPAGKEYALPLEQARDEAAGVGKSDGPAGEKAPLFGEGVEPRDAAAAAEQGDGERDGSGGGGSAGGSSSGGGGAAGAGDASAAAALADSGSGDGYPLSSAVLLVVAVLAVGAAFGLGLRLSRRVSSRPT